MKARQASAATFVAAMLCSINLCSNLHSRKQPESCTSNTLLQVKAKLTAALCECDVKHSHCLLQMTNRFRLRRLSWDWRPVILLGGCQEAGLGLHLYISPSSSHSRSDMVPSQLPPSIQLAGSASSLKMYTDFSSKG